MFRVIRSEGEINRVRDWADRAEAEGIAHFPGETYEAGVAAALRWLCGDEETPPDAD